MIALLTICLLGQAFQPSANAVSDFLRDAEGRYADNLIRSAELMPESKYGFHPTEAQITFGGLLAHVIQTNVALCSATSNKPTPFTPEQLQKFSGTDSKDALVAAVKQSFGYCADVMKDITEADLRSEAVMFGRPTTRSKAATLITLAMDWADHYSTAANYLRLNGVLPPTAQPARN